MKQIILGTAGHVDHGKTSLTQALTGVDTDRLPQEKERGISIQLGFAPLELETGIAISLVDVPGHEKFIKTMVTGATGMDAALLIIAADEGIMPQTTEHLAIIHLLKIPQLIVVLTKCDLVDEEWQGLITEEIRELLATTSYSLAPVIPVSVKTGVGLAKLKAEISSLAQTITPQNTLGDFRMPVDRCFSLKGFGTIAAGTPWSGQVQTGDTLEIVPDQLKVRVRSLQNHGTSLEIATTGQRVALNLAGIATNQLPLGCWLAKPNLLTPTYRLDVVLQTLEATSPLKHLSRVRIHHGAKEVLGRVHLLNQEEVPEGTEALAQLRLETPIPPLIGDLLIIRSYSPATTIGGGKILAINPPRHKRYHQPTIEALQLKVKGDPRQLLLSIMESSPYPLTAQELAQLTNTSNPLPILEGLIIDEQVALLRTPDNSLYYSSKLLSHTWEVLQKHLREYHQAHQENQGMEIEQLRKVAFPSWSPVLFSHLLNHGQHQGLCRVTAKVVALADHQPQADPELIRWSQTVLDRLDTSPFAPEPWGEISQNLPKPLQSVMLGWLQEQNLAIRLTPDIVISQKSWQQAKHLILGHFVTNPKLTLAEARDLFQTSRKYALTILDYSDNQKITRRYQDYRVLY